MRKSAIFAAVLIAVTCSATSCRSNVKKKDVPEASFTTETEGELVQPDPLAPGDDDKSGTTTASSTAGEQASSTTTETSSQPPEETTLPADAEPDPLGIGIYSMNEDGAVVIEDSERMDDDRAVMSAAEKLFNSACHVNWDMTVGCPYSLDMTDTAENEFGWTFYRITDARIGSKNDILDDYYKVFSRKYPADDIDFLFMEKDGKVYALNGARGKDMYYSVSKIKSIDRRTDDEIFFTVENFYENSDHGEGQYSEEAVFSVVIDGDGVWRAGEFTLPY